MTQTKRPETAPATPLSKPDNRNATSDRMRMFHVAGLLAGLVAVVLAMGIGSAGTSLVMNPTPLPMINTAAFVFLAAATVVSGTIVFSFWHHLLSGLVPVETRPATIKRPRPARPLRNI